MSEACRPGGEKSFAQRDGMPLYWARRNFRQPTERAIGFAYTFLGVRIECAQCHKHPFDQWSKKDFDEFSNLFAPIKMNQGAATKEDKSEEREMLASLGVSESTKGNLLRKKLAESLLEGKTVPFGELMVDTVSAAQRVKAQVAQANKKGKKVNLRVPTGKILGDDSEVELNQDPRMALMSWLRSPDNPYFAKAVVNRVWSNYFGTGIVDPTDDMNLANPPSNAPLLDYLANGLIEHDFDLKWLHREIMTSQTYQRSADVNETNRFDRRNFSRHVPRRYPAEVVHDAVLMATLSDEQANHVMETLEGMAITDALSIYGEGKGSVFALDVFGRSTRESNCDCDRSDSPSLLQSVYLRNDVDIHRRLADRSGWVTESCNKLGIAPEASRVDKVKAELNERIGRQKQFMEARITEFNQLPPKRQEQMRPKLKAQYEKLSKQLEAEGEVLLPFAELLKNPKQLSMEVAPAETTHTSASKTEPLSAVVEDAYLRTLSRFPSPEEMHTSLAFFEESQSKSEAVKSLLWALLNTKEFIISH
jgi:hypothetical protein